jgi:uncharacterized protein YdeI (YjbR/CyaY-like superfamily)
MRAVEALSHYATRTVRVTGHTGPVDALNGVEIVAFPDAPAWESWLAANHERQAGVWLKLAKKASGIPSVSDDEVVDVGLCYGWVSGQRKAYDDSWYLQKYVPRRPRSLWSKVNVEKVEALLAEGRMREPGMAEVRAAQADGRWAAAYESQRKASAPPDVVAALERNATARRFFDSLDRSAQYRLYLPVLQARTAEARAARLQKMLAMLEAGETPR